MFGTRRYRDEIALFNTGHGSSLQTSVVSSISGSAQGTYWQDLSKFQRYVYTLYAYGTAAQPAIILYSASNVDSTSKGSSASSNWTAIDSVNAAASMLSTSASTSTSQYACVLDVRAEKLMNLCSTSSGSPFKYIRAIVYTNAASSSSSSVNGYLTCVGLLPAYGKASDFEVSGFVTNETDYI